MLKIGLVGGSGIYHAKTFCEMFNEYDKDLAIKNNWPLCKARIQDARVTHIYDEKREDALLLAKICNVENVVDRKEDMIGRVDGIIIADDTTLKHQKRAIFYRRDSEDYQSVGPE